VNTRKLIKILTIGTAILVGIGIILSTLVYFYIKPVLIKEMNKQLTVKVDVGRISVTKWRHFPKIGVNFNDIIIPESQTHFKKNFLEAKQLSLYVNLLSLMSSQKKIDGIWLSDGEVNMAFLEKHTNFEIVKPSEETSDQAFDFDFKKIQLENVKVNVFNQENQVEIESLMRKMNLKLKFSDSKNTITPSGVAFIKSVKHDRKVILSEKDLHFDIDMVFNGDYSKLELNRGEMGIEEVAFETNGMVYFEKNHLDLDLKMSQKQSDVGAILSLLQNDLENHNKSFDLGGKLSWNATLKGKSGKRVSPEFKFNFEYTNGVVKGVNANFNLNEVTISGNAHLPKTDHLEDGELICQITGNKSSLGDAKGVVTVRNFINPKIKWEGTLTLDPKLICNIAEVKYKKAAGSILLDGQMEFQILGNKGIVKPNSFDFFGNVVGNDLTLDIPDEGFDVSDGNFEIVSAATDLQIQFFNFKQSKTEWNWDGVLKRKNSIFDKNSNSEFVGNVKVKNLDLNDFIKESTTSENEEINGETESVTAIFLPFKSKVKAQIENFKFNNFNAKSIKGEILTTEKSYQCKNCEMEALKGIVLADVIFKQHGKKYLLDIFSNVKKVQIMDLFQSFDNFDQDEITDKHLSGILSGKLIVKQVFDENFDTILDNLYVKTDLTIEDGELKNYEPLKSLSVFAKVDDLRNLKFKTLKNEIEIFNQTIFIPKMDIVSNAFIMKLEGTHNFDNEMDYNIEVSLAKILANKSKWYQRKLENQMEENSLGGLTAFISMRGTPDNLDIKYDRTKSKKQVREEIRQERENIRTIIRTGENTEENPKKDYGNVWDE